MARNKHGHHGGAWKVAYADFVTAMMAFFLLLWLLNAVPKESLKGIANYFAPISMRTSTSGGKGMLQGSAVAEAGIKDVREQDERDPLEPGQQAERQQDPDEDDAPPEGKATEAQLQEMLRKREEKQFAEAAQQIRSAIAEAPDLKGLSKSLIIDNTPEGLRIQIVDQEGLAMFPRGQADMYPYTRRVLELVARVVARMPQKLDITGHTDATPYQNGGATYGNWDLSADRANAARRALAQFGVPEERVARVVGKAATEPLLPAVPEAPGNRRLSVVLLSGSGEQK